jgi:membrane protein implicated in regulation of membrane protease activity
MRLLLLETAQFIVLLLLCVHLALVVGSLCFLPHATTHEQFLLAVLFAIFNAWHCDLNLRRLSSLF